MLEIKSRRIDLKVSGKQLNAWTGGSGPALLLLHSAWGDAELSWSRVWNELGKFFFVIAPDMPGFAASDAPPEPSLASIAVVLKELLDALQVDRVVVVGNSFGAAVAVEFSSTFPESTLHLVLVNGTNLPVIPGFMRKLIGLPVLEKRVRSFMKNFIYGHKAFERAFPDRAALPQGFFDTIQKYADQHSRNTFDAFLRQTIAQKKPSVPATVIWGTGDRLVSDKQKENLKKWLGGPKFVLIEGAGHIPQVERPGEFVQALRNVGNNKLS